MIKFFFGLALGLATLVFWKIGVTDPKIQGLEAIIHSHKRGMEELQSDNKFLRSRLGEPRVLTSSSH